MTTPSAMLAASPTGAHPATVKGVTPLSWPVPAVLVRRWGRCGCGNRVRRRYRRKAGHGGYPRQENARKALSGAHSASGVGDRN